jgi:hypothetical protein
MLRWQPVGLGHAAGVLARAYAMRVNPSERPEATDSASATVAWLSTVGWAFQLLAWVFAALFIPGLHQCHTQNLIHVPLQY